jgi:hypothetical protein
MYTSMICVFHNVHTYTHVSAHVCVLGRSKPVVEKSTAAHAKNSTHICMAYTLGVMHDSSRAVSNNIHAPARTLSEYKTSSFVSGQYLLAYRLDLVGIRERQFGLQSI